MTIEDLAQRLMKEIISLDDTKNLTPMIAGKTIAIGAKTNI